MTALSQARDEQARLGDWIGEEALILRDAQQRGKDETTAATQAGLFGGDEA